MTCQDDYKSNDDCNPRPGHQTNYFNKYELKEGRILFKYSWIIRNVSKTVALLLEKSLTATYILANDGRLPPFHKRPCFKEGEDFGDIQERMNRAEDYIEEMKRIYGQ